MKGRRGRNKEILDSVPFNFVIQRELLDRIPSPKGAHIRALVEEKYGKKICKELSGHDVPEE